MIKSDIEYIRVSTAFANQRIDNFLITRLKGVPKAKIYNILRKGEVRVNKKRIQAGYRLQAGDQIRIPPLYREEKADSLKPGAALTKLLSKRVLYEDKNLLIVNKPSGLPVHGGSQVKIGIIEALKAIYTSCPHLELAHRLDAGTSGCLVLAKKRSILKELHELFRMGAIKKHYWTLTKGLWKTSELIVNASLHKKQLSSGERVVKVVQEEGKAASTLFKVLNVFPYFPASLVEATLLTGRTHQIRVHAQYRKHPIAGDDKYGDYDFNKILKGYGLKRLFLHAYSVEFTLPSTGETIQVQAPLDEDLADCIKKISLID